VAGAEFAKIVLRGGVFTNRGGAVAGAEFAKTGVCAEGWVFTNFGGLPWAKFAKTVLRGWVLANLSPGAAG